MVYILYICPSRVFYIQMCILNAIKRLIKSPAKILPGPELPISHFGLPANLRRDLGKVSKFPTELGRHFSSSLRNSKRLKL
jgi:hypothetical protein